jgi:uncharacterized protein (TIGR02996 family)
MLQPEGVMIPARLTLLNCFHPEDTVTPVKPNAAFPSPAATLPGEADILANVVADLSDDTAKLVYADWLDDRDDKRGPLLREFVTAYRAGKKLPATKAAPRSWADLVGITLVSKLRGTLLEPKTDRFLALAKPALSVRATRAADKTLPVGDSKFGGRPDLPPGAKWPRYEGLPLAFVAQFDLGELHTSLVVHELPASGLLSVFCMSPDDGDFDETGSWRVFHFPDASKLARCEFDDELSGDSQLRSGRLAFTELLTLPAPNSPWGDEWDVDEDAEDDHQSHATDLYREVDRGRYENRLLGFPTQYVHDPLGKKSMRHLLTLTGDGPVGWGWGLVYFTLSETQLRNGQLNKTRAEMQST